VLPCWSADGTRVLTAISDSCWRSSSLLAASARALAARSLRAAAHPRLRLRAGGRAGPAAGAAERARSGSGSKPEGIQLVGLVLNRVHPWPGDSPAPADDPAQVARAERWLSDALAAADPELDAGACARALVGAARTQAALARRDSVVRRDSSARCHSKRMRCRAVPLFADDVHAPRGAWCESRARSSRCAALADSTSRALHAPDPRGRGAGAPRSRPAFKSSLSATRARATLLAALRAEEARLARARRIGSRGRPRRRARRRARRRLRTGWREARGSGDESARRDMAAEV